VPKARLDTIPEELEQPVEDTGVCGTRPPSLCPEYVEVPDPPAAPVDTPATPTTPAPAEVVEEALRLTADAALKAVDDELEDICGDHFPVHRAVKDALCLVQSTLRTSPNGHINQQLGAVEQAGALLCHTNEVPFTVAMLGCYLEA
jgi:hypothetical protein